MSDTGHDKSARVLRTPFPALHESHPLAPAELFPACRVGSLRKTSQVALESREGLSAEQCRLFGRRCSRY